MAIVIISRGSYSHGKEVAEKLAQKLGYECISREVILEASEHFNVPEMKLARAIHDAPSMLERLTFGKEKYVAYIREALLHHLIKDNVVYHGLAGHFLVHGVSHVLKVRILADLEDRVAEEVKQKNITAKEALAQIKKDDEARYRWSQYLYGIDTRDPLLYDLVIHLNKISIDDAVGLIEYTLAQPHFQATPESQEAMQTLFQAAQVQAALAEEIPSASVTVEEGKIVVLIHTAWGIDRKLIARVDEVVEQPGGIKARVHLSNP